MKGLKKLLALLLAMSMMVFAFAACSNQDASQSQNPSRMSPRPMSPPTLRSRPILMLAPPLATTVSSLPWKRASSSCPPTPPSLPMR